MANTLRDSNKLRNIIGQYSDEEFKTMLLRAGSFYSNVDYANNKAWIQYGKSTFNYYKQHEDRSWTNYDCKTKGYV